MLYNYHRFVLRKKLLKNPNVREITGFTKSPKWSFLIFYERTLKAKWSKMTDFGCEL